MSPNQRHDAWWPDTPLIDGCPRAIGTQPSSCLPSVRYRQGRWFARFVVKLVKAVITIIVLAVLVYLTLAMFGGVQG